MYCFKNGNALCPLAVLIVLVCVSGEKMNVSLLSSSAIKNECLLSLICF